MTEILQFSVFYYQNQSKFPLNKEKGHSGSFSLVNNGRIYKKKKNANGNSRENDNWCVSVIDYL